MRKTRNFREIGGFRMNRLSRVGVGKVTKPANELKSRKSDHFNCHGRSTIFPHNMYNSFFIFICSLSNFIFVNNNIFPTKAVNHLGKRKNNTNVARCILTTCFFIALKKYIILLTINQSSICRLTYLNMAA